MIYAGIFGHYSDDARANKTILLFEPQPVLQNLLFAMWKHQPISFKYGFQHEPGALT